MDSPNNKPRKITAMPPSGFSQHAIEGILQFTKGCYKDLKEEIESGKHESFEKAIEFELENLEKALKVLHIDPGGNLVEREPKKSETAP